MTLPQLIRSLSQLFQPSRVRKPFRKTPCRTLLKLERLDTRDAPAVLTWDCGSDHVNWSDRFNWDKYTQATAATLKLKLGPGAGGVGTTADQVTVSGIATLNNGKLEVVGGGNPQVNDQWDIFIAGTLMGTFEQNPTLPAGMVLDYSQPNKVILKKTS